MGLALVAAACGGSSKSPGTTPPNAKAAKHGGTLRLKGAGDVDHLDTAQAYYTVTYTVMRALSRQLVSYPTTTDLSVRDNPVADAAQATTFASKDGLTYTFKIKKGVKWDSSTTPPNRPVVANDFIVGIKRLCIPGHNSGGLVYYTTTIKGFKAFCSGFGPDKNDPTKGGTALAAVKSYIETHAVDGLSAPDDSTIVFKLNAPAGDFLNMLAMPFASAVAPEVALKYEGDSPAYRKHFASDGPYQLAEYSADKSMKLVRNAGWDASTDKLRGAYVDTIQITEGSDQEPVQQEIEANTADLAWDTAVPTPQIASLKNDPVKGLGGSDPQLFLNPDGCVRYIVFNLAKKPNTPFTNVKVRQAVNYALNKAAIIQDAGGPDVQQPTGNVLTPPISIGFKKIDLYPSPLSKGDVAKAKQLLTEAGFPNGFEATYIHANAGKAPTYAQTNQAALARIGIRLKLKPVAPAQFYTQNLSKITSNTWDLAMPGWCPDWPGNGARSFFSPLLDGRALADGTTNYGQVNDPKINSGIDAALAETDLTKAAQKWAALDQYVMEQAYWAPVSYGRTPLYRSSRVKNWIFFPFANNADITNVWLDPTTP